MKIELFVVGSRRRSDARCRHAHIALPRLISEYRGIERSASFCLPSDEHCRSDCGLRTPVQLAELTSLPSRHAKQMSAH